ncbi:hypothetical protein [Amycolatopsis sp. GM8]|uniref:hypothetical protein n=1 Tax=Amycolatopsis sp. GM8 TaxID=2896530 RepID=UPI001F243466|nr:hypothetical protein [Amycolatopsis sp. GM8]
MHWLWLVGAFVLGVAVGALIVRLTRRRVPVVPPPVPAEQTMWIPRVPDEYVDPETRDADHGRRSGTLPIDWPPAH